MPTRPLNILFISSSYPSSHEDWKSVFISHMIHALATHSELKLKAWLPHGEIPQNVEYICTEEEQLWLKELMKHGGIINYFRQNKFLATMKAVKLLSLLRRLYNNQAQKTDVIHVNWLQNSLPVNKGATPLLITVLGSDLKLLSLPGMAYAVRRAIKDRPCIIAPNASWMVPPLTDRFGDLAGIKLIPLGIADAWYSLQRKWLQQEKRKWLVVLRLTQTKIGKLFDWGESIFNKTEHELHLFGPMQEQIDIPDWVTYHGPTHPKELLETWFPQAAGLITLSQHDEGQPQIILEAMASGIPVIASSIPAHSNLLDHQETGWLCKHYADFENAIHQLKEKSQNEQLGDKGRSWVKDQIGTWYDCANRYQQAYHSLLKRD